MEKNWGDTPSATLMMEINRGIIAFECNFITARLRD